MIRVTAVARVFNPLEDGVPLPSLEAELRQVCREYFRRVDRFIELALLGSGRCTAGKTLRPDCGLYLGSGLGPMTGVIATQQQLIRDREAPKPFNFINTLGNSAGYYVAKNLGLHGQNLFISRRGESLQALLSVAMIDLQAGVLSQALVGVVEEATLPLTEHRRRQGLAEDRPVAEGSHWLLLERDAESGHSLESCRLGTAAGLDAAVAQTAERMPAELSGPFHDSLSGAWLTARLGAGAKDLVLVDGDETRGWELFYFRA
ncbi:MAG TPA: hypothetical protein VGH91_13025 [Gammaproteobacteria bacterium]|jgi:hypothetical protein